MDTMIEDVSINVGNGQGPTVKQLRGAKHFSIDFSHANRQWFTSSLGVVPEGTVGEAHRRFLHERLDEYIDWFVKES